MQLKSCQGIAFYLVDIGKETAQNAAPETRKQLAEFALTQPVLISDCEGHYQPYTEIRPTEPVWTPSSSTLRLSLN